MNSNVMMLLALFVPLAGVVYLAWQIRARDLRGWQHYACITSLIALSSILLLVAAGRIESFGLAGNTVKLVDQKLDLIETLTEQNKRIARLSAELVISATTGIFVQGNHDSKAVEERLRALFKEAGLSESQIKEVFANTNRTKRLTIDSE